MKKEQQNKIAGGLDGLLNPSPVNAQAKTQQAATPQGDTEEPRVKLTYKTVCYNLRPDIVDSVKDIAYWDRKRANAVVTEALEQYIQDWKRRNGK